MKHGPVICKQLALGKSWTNFTSKQQKQSSFHFYKDQRKRIIKEKKQRKMKQSLKIHVFVLAYMYLQWNYF